MPPVGFEATVPASERPQNHALVHTATGIGYGRPVAYLIVMISVINNYPLQAPWQAHIKDQVRSRGSTSNL
jgi:hypothetical protein